MKINPHCLENTSREGHRWDTEGKVLTTWLSSHSLGHLDQKIQVERGMSFYDLCQVRQWGQRTASQGQSVIQFLVSKASWPYITFPSES